VGIAKTFSRSEVKGQGHKQFECYTGDGMHFEFDRDAVWR